MSSIFEIAISNGIPISAMILGYFRPLEATHLVGGLLTFGGALGWLRPAELQGVFGVPAGGATQATFLPGIGGRNMAAGLTTLALGYFARQATSLEARGFRRALGIFLGAWTLAGYSDCWILSQTPGSENMHTHVFNIVLLSFLSWRILW